jgi:acyl carrier protein
LSGTIDERVRRIAADVLGLRYEDVTPTTSHETVRDWDSMAMINMAMSLEAEFGIELGVDDAARFVSVAAIGEIVRQRGAR